MSAIAIAEARRTLELYVRAEQDILTLGASTALGDRRLLRADLEQVRKGRAEWERKVADLEAAAAGASSGPMGRIGYVLPV